MFEALTMMEETQFIYVDQIEDKKQIAKIWKKLAVMKLNECNLMIENN